MLRVILTWIVVLNLSSTPLHDAMLVGGDDAIELGCIERGESRRVEIESADSVRVVFRLGDEWIGTDMLPMRDTIEICDKIETFEVEVEIIE
ncbi:MAG: hypothetical protein J6V21_06570 [Alistipes sp.]|nr:hypothetical protein [Alistipes sp.]